MADTLSTPPITGATTDNNDRQRAQPVEAAIDTRAGLATHPRTLEPLAKALTARSGPGHDAFKVAFGALTKVHESIGNMHQAVDAMSMPNPANRILGPKGTTYFVIPESAKEEVRTAMSQSFNRGSQSLGDANKVIDKAEAQIQSAIDARLVNSRRNEIHVSAVASEIRALVKGLPPDGRMSWVSKQIKDGETEAVAAILSAHPAVSGLDRTQHNLLREEASRVLAPEEHGEREALRQLRGKLTEAGQHYLGRLTELLPKPNLRSAEHARALKKLQTGV